VKELLSGVGAGGGAPPVGTSGPAAASGGAAAPEAAKEEEKKEEEKEESDDDMVRSLLPIMLCEERTVDGCPSMCAGLRFVRLIVFVRVPTPSALAITIIPRMLLLSVRMQQGLSESRDRRVVLA
jgi:hypothetical protein